MKSVQFLEFCKTGLRSRKLDCPSKNWTVGSAVYETPLKMRKPTVQKSRELRGFKISEQIFVLIFILILTYFLNALL